MYIRNDHTQNHIHTYICCCRQTKLIYPFGKIFVGEIQSVQRFGRVPVIDDKYRKICMCIGISGTKPIVDVRIVWNSIIYSGRLPIVMNVYKSWPTGQCDFSKSKHTYTLLLSVLQGCHQTNFNNMIMKCTYFRASFLLFNMKRIYCFFTDFC